MKFSHLALMLAVSGTTLSGTSMADIRVRVFSSTGAEVTSLAQIACSLMGWARAIGVWSREFMATESAGRRPTP